MDFYPVEVSGYCERFLGTYTNIDGIWNEYLENKYNVYEENDSGAIYSITQSFLLYELLCYKIKFELFSFKKG